MSARRVTRFLFGRCINRVVCLSNVSILVIKAHDRLCRFVIEHQTENVWTRIMPAWVRSGFANRDEVQVDICDDEAFFIRRKVFAQERAIRPKDTRISQAERTQEAGEVRQALLQAPKSDRDYVRQARGLAAGGSPMRKVFEGLPVRNHTRRSCHLLVMSPELSFGLREIL